MHKEEKETTGKIKLKPEADFRNDIFLIKQLSNIFCLFKFFEFLMEMLKFSCSHF